MFFVNSFMTTVDDVISRLEARADAHGVEPEDLLEKMPPSVIDNHEEVNAWLDMKDVSHIYPQSTHPELANDPDNIVWEDSDVNRARGAEVMTDTEILTAKLDGELDARTIDGPLPDVPEMDWLEYTQSIDVSMDLEHIDIGYPETNPLFW